MGTRADFYVGRGDEAEWLGSIAWDGYPEPYEDEPWMLAKTEAEFREALKAFLATREDATTPELGWPWPWEDSKTTDYAYAFEHGAVWMAIFGHGWFPTNEAKPEHWDRTAKVTFPNMAARQKVTLGQRSGVIVLNEGNPKPWVGE